MRVSAIRAFTDNYIWALQSTGKREVVVVDPGEAAPVFAYLEAEDCQLSAIMVTHHHYDHTNGIDALIEHFRVPVYGPNNPDIPQITHPLADGERFCPAGLDYCFEVIATPGHTLDHLSFYTDGFLFCGDTLFSAGCGRMFEGTAPVFHQSLQRLAELPAATRVYCTHEYTQANVAFAMSQDPDNQALRDYADKVQLQRQEDQITLPSSIGLECAINPFLRAKDAAQFARLRAAKDNF